MFTFPLDTQQLLHERHRQLRAWGISPAIIRHIRAAVQTAWDNGPGGWTYEWQQHALQAEQQKKWLLASACHGAARFPCINSTARQQALHDQLRCYLLAAKTFHCYFERCAVPVNWQGTQHMVMLHLFEARKRHPNKQRPLLFLTGGVDTGKMELHRLASLLALSGFRVCAMDMPGTGESTMPLAVQSDQIYQQVIATMNQPARPVAMLGISFGGHWAAKLALTGLVDAAINMGGPITFTHGSNQQLHTLPNGMSGIVAHALKLPSMPDNSIAQNLLTPFSLVNQGILPRSCSASPLLVINGSDDVYIPQHDTKLFRPIDNTTVWMINNASHCAAEHFPRLLPGMVTWLRSRLYGASRLNQSAEWFATRLLPAWH